MSLTLQAGRSGADGRRYLRWVHSFTFDQDLHLLNDFEATGGSYNLTPTGYIFELANIGTPLMWVPFYGVASFFLPAPTDNHSYPADDLVQLVWLNFSSWLYTVLAGTLTIVALRRLFTHGVLLAATIAILCGTPVLFYMVTFSLSPHPAMLFLAALLLYLWLSNKQKRAFFNYFTIGIVIGWLMMIATYNVALFLLPGFDLLKDLLNRKSWRYIFQNGLAVGAGGILGFLPQMIVWWFLFGSPLYSPYATMVSGLQPYLFETLFSTFHGLFFYAPVLLLVIPGLWMWQRRDGWTALSIGLTWLSLAYIVSNHIAWWAGSSFGNRYFLSLSPFFVFGLASFLQKSKKWGLVLLGLAVLWTLGLYLQFLNGVRLTSDSVVYSAADLAKGQLSAFAQIMMILPQLWVDIPWGAVSRTILPVFILIIIVASRVLYGWLVVSENKSVNYRVQIGIASLSALIVLFIGLAGLRGEQTKASLARQGFYDRPHQVVRHEIKEVAGEAGLVTRAMYYQQTGQPDKATADLKLASSLWKSDTAPAPTRLYLGPKNEAGPNVPLSLHLDYPGGVRLVGYQILEANKNFLKGELFWEKLPDENNSRDVVMTPIVRAFDQVGNNLGGVQLEFPFPANYIPAGGLFKDSFSLQFDTQLDRWIWLAVSIAEDPNALPINALGEPDSSIVASVNVETFPPSPLISVENSQALIGQPALLLGNDYQPGQIIPVQFLWQTSNRLAPDTLLKLTLLDSTEQIVAQQQFTIHNSQFRAKGPLWAIHNSTSCFALPATLPAGDYRLTFALQPETGDGFDEADSLPIRLAAAEKVWATTICDLLEADFARRYEAAAPQNPIEANFTDQIKLLGYDLAIIPHAGSASARVLLYWRAQTHVTQDYLVSLELLDAANQPVITRTGIPANGARPTSTWLKQELILDEHILAVPALAPGVYRLSLSLLDVQTGLPVAGSEQVHLILQDVPVP